MQKMKQIQFDGVVALDKPTGPSSAQCLYAFKKQGQKKTGHAGTLDPMATGVLIVLLGHATKLSGWLLNCGRKTYSGVIRLGIETDTWDVTGKILANRPWEQIGSAEVKAAIKAWEEISEQEVPAYSAAKYNGQPLYKLARKGHDTPVKRKSATIFEAGMLEVSMPFVKFRVTCSSGVYVRSLAHSLGQRLECGAALARLTREYSHPFRLENCCSLEEIQAGLSQEHITSMMDALPEWPRIAVSAREAEYLRNGRAIESDAGEGSLAFLCLEDRPVAIGRSSGHFWLVERGLWNI